MNIAGAQLTPLKVTERVEQEQRMVAGGAEVTIVSRSLLFAMGRTDAAVHVENDHHRWTAVMNTVDPCSAHVGQGFNVCISRQKLCLKTPHLAGGRSLSFDGLTTNNPASEVILKPWNSSFKRRSKSARRPSRFDSPMGVPLEPIP